MKSIACLYLICLLVFSCGQPAKNGESAKSGDGSSLRVEILDPAVLQVIDSTARFEVLAEGFSWTEGPLWIADGNYLLFSDIPPNKIHRWDETNGLQEYLYPSGYTGTDKRDGEPGSNGLLLDAQGRLVLCQHGDRRMARMTAPLQTPKPEFETLADRFEGKRLNSPNDAVFSRRGDLYFTDPPYGLQKNMDDPAKELPFQGVYRLKADGGLELVTDSISRPNGIALSPDETKLYVANSDKNKIWMVYEVDSSGKTHSPRLFFDASNVDEPGSPDGMKVHDNGMIFATGPGGVWIFSPEAKPLGKIRVGDLISNVGFDQEKQWLYLTANKRLIRVQLKSSAASN